MVKLLLTVIAFSCVIGSIGINVFYKDENIRKYKIVIWLLICGDLLFIHCKQHELRGLIHICVHGTQALNTL